MSTDPNGKTPQHISELDLDSFFEENSKVPVKKENDTSSSVPLHFSGNNRLVQDEDKATNPQAKSNATEKDLNITPAFKAAAKRQNEVVKKSLPARGSREKARAKPIITKPLNKRRVRPSP